MKEKKDEVQRRDHFIGRKVPYESLRLPKLRFQEEKSYPAIGFEETSVRFSDLVPDGYIPRLESKERECWKFLDWRLNSENDSRLHGQPSNALLMTVSLSAS